MIWLENLNYVISVEMFISIYGQDIMLTVW